jgi:hypothetical protein
VLRVDFFSYMDLKYFLVLVPVLYVLEWKLKLETQSNFKNSECSSTVQYSSTVLYSSNDEEAKVLVKPASTVSLYSSICMTLCSRVEYSSVYYIVIKYNSTDTNLLLSMPAYSI